MNNISQLQYFPSFYLSYDASDKHQFQLSYDRNIDRPGYNQLNPFRIFQNENNFEEGNPRLLPALSDSYVFNYIFDNTISLSLYYTDNGAYVSPLVFQDNDNLTLRDIATKCVGSTSYGLDITLNTDITEIWNFDAYLSIFSESEKLIAVESDDQEFENIVEGVYLSAANYFTLSRIRLSMRADLVLSWSYLFGSYVQDPLTNLSVGLSKSFMNDKLIFSAAFQDILRTYNPTYTSKYFNQDNSYFRNVEPQQFRVSVYLQVW